MLSGVIEKFVSNYIYDKDAMIKSLFDTFGEMLSEDQIEKLRKAQDASEIEPTDENSMKRYIKEVKIVISDNSFLMPFDKVKGRRLVMCPFVLQRLSRGFIIIMIVFIGISAAEPCEGLGLPSSRPNTWRSNWVEKALE